VVRRFDAAPRGAHAGAVDVPETRYARSGGYHIAYQTLGERPPDVAYLSGWFSHIEARWEVQPWATFMRRIASFGRLIQLDKRGIGLSDPAPLQSLPTLEEWMDDLRAVLDAVESERAAILGWGDSGPMAMLFAATYPDRTSALVLADTYARLVRAPDYPIGMPQRLIDWTLNFNEATWGTGEQNYWFAPDMNDDLRAELARYERHAASPGYSAAVRRSVFELDVRHVLPSIQVPTLVLHHTDGVGVRVGHGRYLAEHIPGARYVELPGADSTMVAGPDREQILDEIEEFLTGVRPVPAVDRILATVLFTDVVDSTKHAAERGDRAWRELLERHRELVRRQLERHRGREVVTTGDGFLATFDGPARAIQCAGAIIQGSRALGMEIRAGLHTGEVELMGEDVGGIAVHIGARVSALAGSGEVLVSSTVKDLVAGSGIEFEDRGAHELKGVPGEWRLFAVRS
jgi:class 3 adenylate cyclase